MVDVKMQIYNVAMSAEFTYVVYLKKIQVFEVGDYMLKDTIETRENPLGILAVASLQDNNDILIFPGKAQGSIDILDLSQKEKKKTIQAHNGELQAISWKNSELINDKTFTAFVVLSVSKMGHVIRRHMVKLEKGEIFPV